MATQTTNLHLTKPDYTDAADIAVINTNMDTLDAKVGAVGNTSLQAQVTTVEGRVTTVEGQIGTVPSGKTLQGQITDNATAITNVDSDITSAMAIVVDGDTAPQNIAQGSYVYIKNHSLLDTGMYHATSAISEDEEITSSNVTADSDGVANALKSNIPSVINSLNSDSTTAALSAAQGKALKQQFAKNTISGGNLNSYKESGCYPTYNCSNAPDTGIGVLLVLRYSSDWVVQCYYNISNNPTAGMRYRMYTNGNSWSSWASE